MTTLYYEGHVIMRPTGPQTMAWLDAVREIGWWHSKLTHERGPDNLEAKDDFIVTTRDTDEHSLVVRIELIAALATGYDLQLLRYKIEAATLDSKIDDKLGLLKPR